MKQNTFQNTIQKSENPMRRIMIEKITLNIGTGAPGEKLEKAIKLLSKISGSKPISTQSKKRIPTWGIRPGLEIGAKVTLRGEKAEETLKKLLGALNYKMPMSKFGEDGNFAFGIAEYLTIPNLEYDASIGIIGLEVAVTLTRPGYRIKKRTIQKRKIPAKHRITKEEAIEFVKNKFDVEII